MEEKIVITLSGGCDSLLLLHTAIEQGYRDIHTLSFNYNQRHNKELEYAKLQVTEALEQHSDKKDLKITHEILDVGFLQTICINSSLTNQEVDNPDISKSAGEAQPSSYVPFRNMLFLTICASYAESVEAQTIWYGATKVDSLAGYWDTTNTFIDNMNNVISENREHNIAIEAPLLKMDKKDIVNRCATLKVNLKDTWTCYSNHESGLADMSTPSSSLRLKGFLDSGYRDPIQYVQQDKIENLYDLQGCKPYPV